ncbi:hypothetical protein K437DRAFT_265528 [Tilletiaria anomala UBC 951]|uniref:Uncharacterized protein n=1 Tax=Tilletiaria anomala (strain ATCC 24038 / CBS 436.72 / UBC 951) TaxID=1037660 RepID=A0A066V8E0_TILAU|nr:uncharacterized protein K437DRAFT_265528 [Tilletiaria anomala UBC 951]KDN35019.1 hypothetical protein K437DRAFT_265528 [Tilletiaria anomala UBC 951]
MRANNFERGGISWSQNVNASYIPAESAEEQVKRDYPFIPYDTLELTNHNGMLELSLWVLVWRSISGRSDPTSEVFVMRRTRTQLGLSIAACEAKYARCPLQRCPPSASEEKKLDVVQAQKDQRELPYKKSQPAAEAGKQEWFKLLRTDKKSKSSLACHLTSRRTHGLTALTVLLYPILPFLTAHELTRDAKENEVSPELSDQLGDSEENPP